MKKAFKYVLIMFFFFVMLPVGHGYSKGKGAADGLIRERGESLDRQIAEQNIKIADLISQHDLLGAEIRVLPFQTTFRRTENKISIESYTFTRDEIYTANIIGINITKVSLHISGGNITRIETQLYQNNHVSGDTTVVQIVDPTPMQPDNDDITFTHIVNAKAEPGRDSFTGNIIIQDKPMREFRNDTGSQMQNDLKSNFIIPHLVNLYHDIRFIAHANIIEADYSTADFIDLFMIQSGN